MDYKKLHDDFNTDAEKREKRWSLGYLNNLMLNIQPEIFYDSNFKEGSAFIEAKEIATSDNKEEVYKYKIKVKEDIPDVKERVLLNAKPKIKFHMRNIYV